MRLGLTIIGWAFVVLGMLWMGNQGLLLMGKSSDFSFTVGFLIFVGIVAGGIVLVKPIAWWLVNKLTARKGEGR